MKNNLISLILLLTLSLNACTLLQTKSDNQGLCKELKHRIISTNATNDPQTYMQNHAELGNLSKDYRSEGCT